MDEKDAGIADTILTAYIAVGRLFPSATFREVAQKAFEAKYRPAAHFSCSHRFISDLTTRNKFSSR
jgi:hypothetical protein